jgi:RNA-directed DNA polymerase
MLGAEGGRQKRSARNLAGGLPYFVVACESRDDAEQVIGELTAWLAVRGLALSPEKTSIVHLEEGFDFLGYHVRHYKDARTKTGRTLRITPSKAAAQSVRDTLRATWLRLKGAPTVAVCEELNRIIRGWANYHRVMGASRTFVSLDSWMYHRAYRWAKHRHPGKSHTWRTRRYWGNLNPKRRDHWVFGDKHSGVYLLKFAWYRWRQHILVKGTASPDNPALRDYWRKRQLAKARDLSAQERRLAGHQEYNCAVCGDSLFNEEGLRTAQVTPHTDPHRHEETNLRLVHLLCYQQLRRTRPGPPPAPRDVKATGS